jgi:hypothetical protein
MSKNRKKIAEAIQTMSSPAEDTVMSGYVKEVDESKATMSVVLNLSGQVVEGVMLHALAGSLKGMVVIPEQDSDVVICSVDGSGEYMLVQADKIKKVLLDISNIQAKVSDKIEINCDEIVFNGGNNGGLVLSDKITERLQLLEQDINILKTGFNGWSPIYESALKTALSTWISSQLQMTNSTDLQNSKITH